MKTYHEITLMHLLIIVIFAHSVKIDFQKIEEDRKNIFFFFIAIANDSQITQKSQRPVPNPDDIKTAVFCRNEKVKIVQRLL